MSEQTHHFSPNDLGTLQDVSEKVEGVATVARARVVVEVWDEADTKPIAWVEMHPDDSDPTVRFHTTPTEAEDHKHEVWCTHSHLAAALAPLIAEQVRVAAERALRTLASQFEARGLPEAASHTLDFLAASSDRADTYAEGGDHD